MANVAVVGAQWGDEGKGKLVDWLSERADFRTVEAMENAGVAALKVRERIKLAGRLRIEHRLHSDEHARR